MQIIKSMEKKITGMYSWNLGVRASGNVALDVTPHSESSGQVEYLWFNPTTPFGKSKLKKIIHKTLKNPICLKVFTAL